VNLNKRLDPMDLESVDDTPKRVNLVTKAIYATISINSDKTKVQVKLPSPGEVDCEILALAIERLLAQSFKIVVPGKVMMKLKEGKSVKFLVKPFDDLPPLTILVLLEPDKRQLLSIQGVEPVNGVHGYSVLVFHWQQESGVVDNLGNIDLKKINKLPGVKTDSLLAKIYQHTNGQPGISCFGKRIRQSVGIPIKVKWDVESVSRIEDFDDMSDAATYQLFAKKGGIVEYSLSQDKNPKTLRKISINDTITITGDVDYGVGDQGELTDPKLGCESNIIVEGNVRGIFSIQSNGYIQVKKAIEGTVSANDVETSLITGGSSVTAKKNIIAGSIINATAKATTITVKENTNGSALYASEKVVFEENTTCMSMKVIAKKVESESSRFSGVNTFTLGEELFVAVEKHAAEMKKINKKLNEYGGPLKELAGTIVDHLALINSIVRKGASKPEPEVLQFIGKIKSAIITGFQSVETSIDERVVPVAYRLQDLLGKKKFDESVLRKVDLLIKAINTYNQKEKEVAPYVKGMHVHKTRLNALRSQLSNELMAEFTNVELLSASSELRIYCGEAEFICTKQDIPGKTFTVKYHPPEEIEKLRKGTLQVSS